MRTSVFLLIGCAALAGCGDAESAQPSADAEVDAAESSVDTATGDTGTNDTGVALDTTDASDTALDGVTDGAADAAEGLDSADAAETADGSPDSADTADTIAPDTGPADTGSVDTGPADTGCGGTVSTTTTDLYVDKASTAPSVGNAACPFRTIREATELAWSGTGTRTVHVKAATYTESGIVRVRARVALVGEGAATTKITGGNATTYCYGPPVGSSTPCMVYVESAGSVDGFSVGFTASTTAGDGLVLGDEAGVAPIVKNVTVTGIPRNGISTLGAAELGPNLHADKNGGSGVSSGGSAAVLVHVVGTTNSFDGNAFGFGVIGGAILTFEGGTASGNSVHGLALSGPTGSSKHVVTALVAKKNAYVGVSVSSQASLTLRDSVVLENGDGLRFYYGTTNKLDIGTSASPGNNVFNAPTTAANLHVGVCLASAPATGAQPAIGNKWSACPVVQTAIAACDGTGPARDAAFAPATSGPNPLVTTGCSVGP